MTSFPSDRSSQNISQLRDRLERAQTDLYHRNRREAPKLPVISSYSLRFLISTAFFLVFFLTEYQNKEILGISADDFLRTIRRDYLETIFNNIFAHLKQ